MNVEKICKILHDNAIISETSHKETFHLRDLFHNLSKIRGHA